MGFTGYNTHSQATIKEPVVPNMQTQYYTLEHRDSRGISTCCEVPEGVQFIAIIPGAKRVLAVRRGTGLFAPYTDNTPLSCAPEYFGSASMATFDRLLDEPEPPTVPYDFSAPTVEQLRIYAVSGGGYAFLDGTLLVTVSTQGLCPKPPGIPLDLTQITGVTNTFAVPHPFEIR
jgi:hypothetical protein